MKNSKNNNSSIFFKFQGQPRLHSTFLIEENKGEGKEERREEEKELRVTVHVDDPRLQKR